MRSAGLLMLAAALAPSCSHDDAPPAQRVIVISCDTLRADRLGVYGYDRPTSPALDAFAREALVFDEAWSCAPMTLPSVSAMWASRLPAEVGVARGNRAHMPTEVTTLAELVSAAGLSTAAVVSNWVLRRPEEDLGDVGVAQGFEHYDDRMDERELNRDFWERRAPGTTDAALEWIDARPQDRFLLYVHYQDPHGPYDPPQELVDAFARPPTDEPELEVSPSSSGLGHIPAYQELPGLRAPESYRARYDAEIRHFDDELGRLLRGLEERDLLDGALVIVTSDHGESLGEHDYWFCHGEHVYRDLVRVPFLVRYPDGAARPDARTVDGVARVATAVGHLDVLPTVLDALGLPAHPSRGTTLLTDRIPEDRLLPHTLVGTGYPGRWLGLTDGRWHLVRRFGSPVQLYDVRADPAELHDLASERPELVRTMLERWKDLRVPLEDTAHLGAEAPLDERARRALQGLGYIDGE